MEDESILSLYEQRDEAALTETRRKFGGLCRSIARQILGSVQDTEECINDLLLKLWHSIPPAHPIPIAPYLSTVMRRICFDRYHYEHAAKRGGGEVPLVVDELSECLAGAADVEAESDANALRLAINRFLGTLPTETRVIFLERYFLLRKTSEIAKTHRMGLSQTKMTLSRTREKLRKHLEEEGLL